MDESWRLRMGMPSAAAQHPAHSRRRSTEDTAHRYRNISGEPVPAAILLDPEDFNDVFGGPPRIVMSRQFSVDGFSRSSFYEGIFKGPENVGLGGKFAVNGRSLPEFNIPGEKGGRNTDRGFYSDIFGSDEEEVRRSRTRSGSKSKASSSSALSSEELSPLPSAVGGGRNGDEDGFSLFASRLRPINIPSKCNSRRMAYKENQRPHDMLFSSISPPCSVENDYTDNKKSSRYGLCPGNSSPESVFLESNTYCFVKPSTDEFVPNSPSSAVSSVCQHQETVAGETQDEIMQEQSMEDEEEEDDVMNSYVIEINSDSREGTDDAIGVDEAIAWAKEKFQKHCSENNLTPRNRKEQFSEIEEIDNKSHVSERQKIDGNGYNAALEMEMELLDENVRLWSTGKDADIPLLLSTLHHILWPDSGWSPVSLATLIETSGVRKAYQKARLCLHPDKLQQRGATFTQKYVAEKAFSILQDAWAAFVSQDVHRR